MLASLFAMPLQLLPKPVTAVTLSIVLNLFFKRYPELKERLTELSGKIFEFHVEDQSQSFFMEVTDSGDVRIHTYADSLPHVVMSGKTGAFLSLLFSTTDPDSLFFSRQLQLSGETDTGLRFKNILDNVEIDWEKELTVLFGIQGAKVLMDLARRAEKQMEAGKIHAESNLEAWINRQNAPRAAQLQALKNQSEAMTKELDRLEGRIARASKRFALLPGDARKGASRSVGEGVLPPSSTSGAHSVNHPHPTE
ncbi:MAG: SCP2 sterol-binding domain-containing protein [Magnetococcales bacterium]|nr:SCP2 sterol-binding domain-containing protein [Magnetococcales bacterium]